VAGFEAPGETHPIQVVLHTPPNDLHKRFDALSGLVITALSQDPTSGHLFLFVNRHRDRLKILYWDCGDGLAIWYKRLEINLFQLPMSPRGAVLIEMTPTQLALILPSKVGIAPCHCIQVHEGQHDQAHHDVGARRNKRRIPFNA
jgi:transposase